LKNVGLSSTSLFQTRRRDPNVSAVGVAITKTIAKIMFDHLSPSHIEEANKFESYEYLTRVCQDLRSLIYDDRAKAVHTVLFYAFHLLHGERSLVSSFKRILSSIVSEGQLKEAEYEKLKKGLVNVGSFLELISSKGSILSSPLTSLLESNFHNTELGKGFNSQQLITDIHHEIAPFITHVWKDIVSELLKLSVRIVPPTFVSALCNTSKNLIDLQNESLSQAPARSDKIICKSRN